MGVFSGNDVDNTGDAEVTLKTPGGVDLLGQQTSAGSLPVVIASNQSAIPVTGTFTGSQPAVNVLTNQTLTTSGTSAAIVTNFDVSKEITVAITINGPVTGTTPTLSFSLWNLDQAGNIFSPTTSATFTTATTPTTFLFIIKSNRLQLNWTLTGTTPSFGGVYVTLIGSAALTTQPISAATLPLPTGAATSANQTTEIASLASIDAGIPAALGQTTMAASMPVVLASNQSAIPVTGTFTSAPVSSTGNDILNSNGDILTISTLGYGGLKIHVTGGFVGTITPYVTINGSQVANIAVYNVATKEQTTTITTTGIYMVPVASTFSVQLYATPWTSGSATVYWVLTSSPDTYPEENGELYSGYQPDISSLPTGILQTEQLDASGRLEAHSAVTTDEGSWRDDFIGGAVGADWAQTISGTGASILVANSNVTINIGTANGNVAAIRRDADYLPIIAQSYLSISQRIANQTLVFGLTDNLTPTQAAYVSFTGTTNTVCTFFTQSSVAVADQQSSTVTLPNGATTATANLYKIDLSANAATLSINGVVVAQHTIHIPDPYAVLLVHLGGQNTAAVTNTSLVCNYAYILNRDRVQIDDDFSGENIPVRSTVVPSDLAVTAVAAAAAAVTLTLPAVTNQYHYITSIEIQAYSTAARTGSATPITVTSTNLPGSTAWTFATAAAIGTTDLKSFSYDSPKKSVSAGTATTLVCPATTGVIWRVNVSYYTGV
jgi:hypothetical protein